MVSPAVATAGDVSHVSTTTLISTLGSRIWELTYYIPLSYLPIVFVVLLPFLYWYLTSENKKVPRQFFSSAQPERFNKLRRAAFPPPYPNGWWKVCDVADLDNGRVQSTTALGHDIVIFKGEDGKIGALHAFCPHMGAHLGAGSKVIGNSLRCPFHGWSFNHEGKCTNIPYTTSCDPPAPNTTAKTFQTCIWMRMVFVWVDAEGRDPWYQLEPMPTMEHEWRDYCCIQSTFDMHISEMCENSADYYHFNYLHAPLPIPLIGWMITVRHNTELFFPKESGKDHLCYFDNNAEMFLFNKIPLSFTKQLTRVTFEGPSIVHFDINTPLGHMHLIKTLLPIEPFKQYCEDRWFCEKRTPSWLMKIVAMIAKGALEQDRTVWENRRYNQKPNLVKGDGPFPVHRRYWRQFYSEHSAEVGKFQTNMEW